MASQSGQRILAMASKTNSRPVYREMIDSPRWPTGGDRKKLIALYERRLRRISQKGGTVYDSYYVWLAHFLEMEDETQQARAILEEGLRCFPESQLLLTALVCIIWFCFRDEPESRETLDGLVTKLKPENFDSLSKARLESLQRSIDGKERFVSPEFVSVLEGLAKSKDWNDIRLYEGGWELTLTGSCRNDWPWDV